MRIFLSFSDFYFVVVVAELQELPFGTGSLYVSDTENPHLLRKETRSLNATERAEAVVVQYLALGGHTPFTGIPSHVKPLRVFSSIHTGPGQVVFGYSEKQRADVMLAFEASSSFSSSSKIQLHFHNYHGYFWHYQGHMDECPSTSDRFTEMRLDKETTLMDSFRRGYAQALSAVSPDQVTFHYHVSYECQFNHGVPVDSLDAPRTGKTYYNVQELLAAERSEQFYLPPPREQKFFNKEILVRDITAGTVDGFVTLKGGREARQDPVAARHFGFCVQNFAPTPSQLSDYTKTQISDYYHLSINNDRKDDDDDDPVENYLNRQTARTLNSTTFHSEETVSTNYLRWLIKERGFCDFEVTHFLWSKFGHQSRHFIEPLLQLRHEMKKAGNMPAAEVLKLILNGAYG
jgi:hypothetical protein